MKKLFSKVLMLALVLAATFMLAGCDVEENFVVDANGKVTMNVIEWLTADEMKILLVSSGADENIVMTLTDIQLDMLFAEEDGYMGAKIGDNGLTYFGIKGDTSDIIPDEGGSELTVTAAEFIYTPKSGMQEEIVGNDLGEMNISEEEAAVFADMMNIIVNVTMPEEIVQTNGTLSEDKRTASFKVSASEDAKGEIYLYAYTAKSDKVVSEPDKLISLKGVTDDGKYTKAKKIYVVCEEKIKYIKVNGVEQKSKTISTKKNGVYTIEVATENSEQTFTVIRDASKPKVSGVKNDKTYNKSVTVKFSDAGSGIKSATLNGKKISTKKKVKANGDYTLIVTDNAGNEKTVKFTIKK